MLILASASPRRAELLRSAGIDFTVCPADVDETPREGESPRDYVARLSRDKARAVEGDPVLAADTVVVLDGEILGKPADVEEAVAMLRGLSGRSHKVLTAFTVRTGTAEYTEAVETRVTFRPLTEDEIRAYVQSGDPMDKAGAYGIQSGAASFVKRIDGSYTNVVGLPLAEVIEALR